MKNLNNTEMQVAKGYMEMGAINLAISQADFEFENEAMRLGDANYEMDRTNSQGNAQ